MWRIFPGGRFLKEEEGAKFGGVCNISVVCQQIKMQVYDLGHPVHKTEQK
jgi:hypothetical protein